MKEKVTLKPILPKTIYFPSVDEFAQFLGLGVSARSKARIFKDLLPFDIGISSRSLDNLGNQGIKSHGRDSRLAFPAADVQPHELGHLL